MISTTVNYRQLLKATSLFGGVQVFNILVTIVRSKVIAVLLGPAGIGISGLLTATTGLVSGFTNAGLGTSSVRDVASGFESRDSNRLSRVIRVLRRLIWITGVAGALITLLLSPVLSRLTFGHSGYTVGFAWLSATLLFNQLANGRIAVLQGMHRLKDLAKANMSGSLAGLLLSLPVYYFWRVEGIVPALIITSVATLASAWYFSRRTDVEKVRVSWHDTAAEGKGMIRMGFMLSLSGLITTGASYLVRVYISNRGGIQDVGLYHAGFALISTYVGLVFTAMGTDYYPRLSGLSDDNRASNTLINHQAEISILVLAPILSIFLVFMNWVIILLYSTKFIPVNGMLQWAALGMYFKAASWAIGFVMLARGASKVFFFSELIANSYILALNILGYRWMGLEGLGLSFLVSYFLVLLQVYLIANRLYGFRFTSEFYRILLIQSVIGTACFAAARWIPSPWLNAAGLPLVLLSGAYSFRRIRSSAGIAGLPFRFFKGGDKH